VPPYTISRVTGGNFLKNGGFVLSDMWDQNRLFSRFELTPGGSGWCPRTEKRAKKEVKVVKKGSKMAIMTLFRPLFDVFQPA